MVKLPSRTVQVMVGIQGAGWQDNMEWLRLRHLAEYFVFRTLVCIVQALSPGRTAQVARGLANLVHYWLPRRLTRHAVARDNIRQALGSELTDRQIDAIIFGMWNHLFLMMTEIVQLPRRLRLDNVVEMVDFRQKYYAVSAICAGRPVIVVSGHFGNWEMAVSIFGLFGMRMGVVARDLDNPYLNRWFSRFRSSTGHQPISKNGGGGEMVNLLQRSGFLAVLGDQDAGSTGMFVDFFGRQASTHKSIGVLALEYNALICVGYARRLPGQHLASGWPRFEIGCEELIDPLEFDSANRLREITQRYTAALERAIRRSPDQYFWVHRRWKSVPKPRVRRQVARAA